MTATLQSCLIAFLFAAGVLSAHATTSETFDINRYNTAGEGWFKTFHVEHTQLLQTALESGVLIGTMEVLVTQTAAGKLALIMDQMAFHHIAQGTENGKDWMATF